MGNKMGSETQLYYNPVLSQITHWDLAAVWWFQEKYLTAHCVDMTMTPFSHTDDYFDFWMNVYSIRNDIQCNFHPAIMVYNSEIDQPFIHTMKSVTIIRMIPNNTGLIWVNHHVTLEFNQDMTCL